MRLEGWEERLHALIEGLSGERYELGRRDCFWLACQVVQALTGVDRWTRYAGTYRTRREALLAIAQRGRSFEDAGTAFFGAEPVSVRLARRGDVCAYQDGGDEKHLVICMGAHAVGMAPEGVVRIPVSSCLACWRIG